MGKERLPGKRAGETALCGTLLAMLLALCLAVAPPASAADPYEPNGSILSATGPLAPSQTYGAGLDTSTDTDFFYFYVTSPGATPISLTVGNLGGGSQSSDIQAMVIDTSATPVGGLSFISPGESNTLSLSLAPQKYFIEVSANTGFGDAYSFVGGGGAGAFGSYGEIAGRCAAAKARTAKAKRKLRRAASKLQRTTARVRRSRFNGRRARRSARRAHRKARRRRLARKRALSRAKQSQLPWCAISA